MNFTKTAPKRDLILSFLSAAAVIATVVACLLKAPMWIGAAAIVAASIMAVTKRLPQSAVTWDDSKAVREGEGAHRGADNSRLGFTRSGIFGVGIITFLAALFFFWWSPTQNWIAWLLYAPSLVVIVGALGDFRGRLDRSEALLLFVILFVGAAVRLYQLGILPFGIWFDEAQNILVANRIATESGYWPVFIADLSQLPAFPFYYYSVFVRLLGADIYSLRLAVTIVALGSILTTWLLARELFGPKVALFAAAFLALSRWHWTFSRFGMANIFVTFFAPLVLFFFVRGQRRKSARDSVIGGIALGLGLQTYYAFLLLPALLAFTYVHRLARKEQQSLRCFVLFLLSAFLVYAPVILYAKSNWKAFSQRVNNASAVSPSALVSAIKQDPSSVATVLAPVIDSSIKHVGMFHIAGDRNGRHNLPAAPMTDPVTGALFVIGATLLLIRFLDSRSTLLVGWCAMSLAVGILSLSFEAPQAARTLGITPGIAILAALPIGLLTNTSGQPRSGRIVCSVLLGMLMLGCLAFNLQTFLKQLNDGAVSSDFGAAVTRVGQISREAAPGTRLVVQDSLSGGPVIELLKPSGINLIPFSPIDELPVRCGVPAARYLLDPNHGLWVEVIRSLYPHADVTPFSGVAGGNTVLTDIKIKSEDVQSLCLSRDQIQEHDEVLVRWNGDGERSAGLPRGAFRVTAAQAAVLLKGAWKNDSVNLFRPSIPYGGLLATVHPINETLQRSAGIQARAQIFPLLNWYFHVIPAPLPFRMKWRGFIRIAHTDLYEFEFKGRDGFTMDIDGRRVLSTPEAGSTRGEMHLTQGDHPIVATLDFVTGQFEVNVRWRSKSDTNGTFQPIPSANFIAAVDVMNEASGSAGTDGGRE